MRSKRAQSAPAPGDHASSAATLRVRSADRSTLESVGEAIARHRLDGHELVRRAVSPSSSRTSQGIVSSDGPASKR